jgi:hypothetical protein
MLLEFRMDRMGNEKRELNSDIKQLQKEIDELFEKKHAAALRVKRASDDNEKQIEQGSLDHYNRRVAVSEKNLLKKEKELEELNQKVKIMESRLYEIKEKTPRRSGNSLKQAGRRVPSSVNVSDVTAEEDGVLGGGIINFDTPAAATTPTATSSEINRMLEERNNKRKRTPESIDLRAQDEDDDDDDDNELFKKMI